MSDLHPLWQPKGGGAKLAGRLRDHFGEVGFPLQPKATINYPQWQEIGRRRPIMRTPTRHPLRSLARRAASLLAAAAFLLFAVQSSARTHICAGACADNRPLATADHADSCCAPAQPTVPPDHCRAKEARELPPASLPAWTACCCRGLLVKETPALPRIQAGALIADSTAQASPAVWQLSSLEVPGWRLAGCQASVRSCRDRPLHLVCCVLLR